MYLVNNIESFEDEYIVVKKLGIDVELVEEVNFFFKVKGVLKFKN